MLPRDEPRSENPLMTGVLLGFAVVGFIIIVGYVAARFGTLGPGADRVLSKLAFNFGTPALMFTLLARSHITDVITPNLVVVVISSLTVALLFAVAAAIFRWGIVRGVIGALSSSYVNAGNLGIPIAVYVLGTATAIAPVMLFQLIVMAPVALTVLDVASGSATSVWRRVLTPFRNPITVASLAGLAVSISEITLPDPLLEPLDLIAQATVPVMLIAFGMGLHGSLTEGSGRDRYPVLLAVVLKSVIQPAIAVLLALWFGLDGVELMAAVLCSSLPTAQNIFVYAGRYDGGVRLARRVILLTTGISIPVLVLLAWLVPLLAG